MGCNCKQTKQVETKVIVGIPEPTPTPVEELNKVEEIKQIEDGTE